MEIQKIAKRYIDSIASDYKNNEKAIKYLNEMLPDGSWGDLDYEGTKKPFWRCVEHFFRLNAIALYGKDMDAVIKGLEFWFTKERKDPNWWWNEIGVPMRCAPCAVLVNDRITEELRQKICSIFNERVADHWTGANRTWLAQNVIINGILNHDENLIYRGKQYIEDNIYIAGEDQEGIRSDYSFAQHGNCLYNFAYGLSLLNDCCWWIKIFQGTKFEFAKSKIDLLCQLVLEGNRYMVYHDVVDFNTIGREIARGYEHPINKIPSFKDVISILKEVSDKEAEFEELERFIHRKASTPGFVWTKMFHELNFMTHFRESYYVSTKFGSKYVLGADVVNGKCVNGEDLLSGFRGCFLTHYLVDGDEYDNIFPLWDWGHLPGVTCPDVELPTELGAYMKSEFACGASNGLTGVCAIDLKESFDFNGIVDFGAKKSCFYFDHEIIHLGCDLFSTSTLDTTMNQCYLKGDVLVDGVKVSKGNHTMFAQKVYHNKIAYCFPTDTEIHLSLETVSKSWKRITKVVTEEPLEKTGELFKLYISHSDERNSYEYAVLPDATYEQAKNYVFPPIINESTVQAVMKDNVIYAVFYESCKVEVNGKSIFASGAGVAIIDDGNVMIKTPKGYPPIFIEYD